MHRALENAGEGHHVPTALVLSRICEEFKVDPIRAIELIEDDPDQWVFQIMEVRGYTRAKDAWDHAQGDSEADQKRRQELLADKIVQEVVEMEFILAEERRRK